MHAQLPHHTFTLFKSFLQQTFSLDLKASKHLERSFWLQLARPLGADSRHPKVSIPSGSTPVRPLVPQACVQGALSGLALHSKMLLKCHILQAMSFALNTRYWADKSRGWSGQSLCSLKKAGQNSGKWKSQPVFPCLFPPSLPHSLHKFYKK